MSERSKLQEQFADEVFDAVQSIAKEYGIANRNTVVQRNDPMILGVRGTIEDGEEEERVEVVLQVSSDLKKARERSITSHQVSERAERSSEEIFRSFNIADVDPGEFGSEGETILPSGERGDEDENEIAKDQEEMRDRVEFLKNLDSLDDLEEM